MEKERSRICKQVKEQGKIFSKLRAERKSEYNTHKRERGITLIALVITVIVLLILAGITISALSGDNGILENAGKAKEETEISQIKEQAEIVKQGVITENLVEGTEPTRDDIINAILDEMGGTAEGNLITTEDGKYEIMVKEDNTIEVVEKGQGYMDAEYKDPAPASDFEYTIDSETNTVTITKYIGTDTVVNIPETIEGKTVVKLGGASFSRCNLQSVKIPNTVQTIEMMTFRNNELTYVSIPRSVTSIGLMAFNENKLNEEQAFIYGRTSTGEEDKTSIIGYGGNQTDIIIPETVITIGQMAFMCSDSIESVIIGDNVIAIGLSAFASCPNLTKVVIGKNVTRLELMAFYSCSKLVDVEFKGDVPNFNYMGSGDEIEAGDGSASGTINVTSSMTFTYNENLRIKVPKGKLEDYKTAKVTLNGEEYYDTLDTWFFSLGEADESWLDVFYE